MDCEPVDVLQGMLNLLVLKALAWGPMHGYSILSWLRQTTDGELKVEDAALYPALHRMEARGWIESEWGISENSRRAKYYRLTEEGRRQLHAETAGWHRYVAVIARILNAVEQPA